MYGAQTDDAKIADIQEFENDVEMYGAQTTAANVRTYMGFENDVEMYGAQTLIFEPFGSL